MERILFAGWVLECDAEATQRAHAARRRGASEHCGCASCRNFAAVRTLGLGAQLRRLLSQLGVPPDRETGVQDAGPAVRCGCRRYHGWYHAVGRIVHDPMLDQDPPGDPVVDLPRGVRVFITEDVAAAPASFDGLAVFRVEFSADLPWILDEPTPERTTRPGRPREAT